MDWYPGATKKLIAKHVRKRTVKPNALVFHVAVSETTSLFTFFSGAAVCSHFYIRKNGIVEQYLPISSKSSAEAEGNNRTISVETQGGKINPNTELWTPEQVKALADLAVWLNKEHNIPLRLMENSKTTEAGIGWHRLGINGNFPSTGILAGRTQRGGGEIWSSSFGKICPGDAKIKQVPGILALAKGTPMALGDRILKLGMTGEDVKELQIRLNKLPTKLARLKDDGVYGPLTKGRVEEFQTTSKIESDGVFGPISLAALVKAETPIPTPVPEPTPEPEPTPTPDPIPEPNPKPDALTQADVDRIVDTVLSRINLRHIERE